MKKIIWVVVCSFTLLIVFILGFSIIFFEKNKIKSLYLNNNDKIVIELASKDKTFCFIGNKLNNVTWAESIDGICVLDFRSDNDFIFLKDYYGNIRKFNNIYDLNTIKEMSVNNKIYLAVGGKEKLDYTLKVIKGADKNIRFESSDQNIAVVNEQGLITGKSIGKTKIILSAGKTTLMVDVIVTDKITLPKEDYDFNRDYIKCDEYTKEENDLIDEILASRISKVGKSTRAAVVEAARFLTLEFPKRIPYFGENGRLSYSGNGAIDGEGRYYKEGMFLSSSRYENISKSMYGPGSWGCNLYSYPNKRTIPNGLDCSGFVSWAFINAGFDVGDIGAGITEVKDFTDLGVKKYVSNSVKDNSIRVGDLLSGRFSNGGHIAIVVGIHNGYYYVAESLYADSHTYYGVITRKYEFDKLKNYFTWHIDMANFYNNNGNVTNYWIN